MSKLKRTAVGLDGGDCKSGEHNAPDKHLHFMHCILVTIYLLPDGDSYVSTVLNPPNLGWQS